MRKTLVWLLAGAMIAACLPAMAVAEAGKYETPYTITWTTYLKYPFAEDAVIVKKIEEKFNVDIQMLNIEDSTFMEVLNTSYIAAGNTPDVIRMKDPAQLLTYVDQGVIAPIDMEMVKTYAPLTTDRITNFSNGEYWNMGVVDGKTYAIPSINATNAFHLPIVYNQKWLDKLGVTELPKTLEEFEKLMYRFAKEDPDGNGKDDTYGLSSDGLRVLFGAFGINPGAPDGRTDHSYFQLNDEGNVIWAAQTEEYKQALAYAQKWYKDGVLDPEFITGENTGGYWAISHSFINGRIGMTCRGNYYHWEELGSYEGMPETEEGAVIKEMRAVDPEANITFGDPVTGPEGKSGVKAWNMLMNFYCFGSGATEDPGKFQRILEIMDFMNQQYLHNPSQKEFMDFIYGDYYTVLDEENFVYKLTDDYYAKYPMDAAVDQYGPMQWGPNLPFPLKTKQQQWAYSLGYAEHGILNLMQFSLPKMAEFQTNITNLKDQMMIEFIKGDRNLTDGWSSYIDELNANGLKDMVQEVVDWYASTH